MLDQGVILDLVLVLAAASVGGVLALVLKQPVIVGYLLAGVLIGPFTPGPVANVDQLRLLVEVGVALLLFSQGASMSLSSFKGLGRVVIFGGVIQIAFTIALGLLFVPWLKLSLAQGMLLGTILAQSSTAVIAKILNDRGETDSVHGRIAIGVSVVQDVSSFPLLLILLVFLGDDARTVPSFLLAVGEVFGMAVVTYLLGRVLWPRILDWVGRFGSGELTLLTAIALALVGGLAMEQIGLSFALGAFLAGLVLAGANQRSETLLRLLPLRDVLAAFFFVSIGTLFDPGVLKSHFLPFLGVVAALVVGKGLVSIRALRALGSPRDVAVLSGLLLAQIGEFAFLLANIGLNRGAISQALFTLIVGAAVASILVNSLLLDSAPPVLAVMARVTGFRPLRKRPVLPVSRLWRRRAAARGRGDGK